MGIGVIAGGILVACLAVLLLGLLPCYLKRRRARLRKPAVVDTENGAITQVHHESDSSITSFAKPLSVVKEESIRSVTSLSQASSETVVPTVETEERRSPPPSSRLVMRKGSLPSSPSSSLRRFGDRAGGAPMPAPPPPLLVRPGSADSDHDRGFLNGNASAPARSRSVRFAEQNGNGRVTRAPSSAHSVLPNPWDRDRVESPPPLPGSSFEQAPYQLPPVPESAPPVPRRAYSLRAPGLPRSPRDPRDFPVSLRAETRSPSIRETASEHRKSFVDARRPIRPI
ncbi:hypothetical protein EDB83DRAFT_2403423 [Lactarius deliciosus]|nr:hypothetical protein EDB83DRAFT_2403423 [Lactarius deliciosus]